MLFMGFISLKKLKIMVDETRQASKQELVVTFRMAMNDI
jgi:hypothetical protein